MTGPRWQTVENALDALWVGGVLRSGGNKAHAEAFAALASLKAEMERQEERWHTIVARAEKAEAENERLREALKEIVLGRPWERSPELKWAADIARAALRER